MEKFTEAQLEQIRLLIREELKAAGEKENKGVSTADMMLTWF